jgi:uracil-DNA glycosylase
MILLKGHSSVARQGLVMESSATKAQTWTDLLGPEKAEPYFRDLLRFVAQRRRVAQVYPEPSQVFESIRLCPLERLKAVIVGQDPYHGPGQAHGLCFSVQPGVRPPPSLVNMFQEMESDLGIPPANHGFLESWSKQGVLLLNSVLTVERSKPKSHADRGWERFTDKVIEMLNTHCRGLVFILWGSHAQKKGSQIDGRRHLALKSPHPSPYSADRGFFGCRHFSKCNQYLVDSGREPIEWALPSL